MLFANQISKSFPGVKALDMVDFDLRHGEVHALVGENGAGKSTLIKILAGVYHKDRDSGEILLNEKEVNFMSPHDAFQAGISVIHQEINLVPHLSIAVNVFLHNLPRIKYGWKRLLRFIDRPKIVDEADSIFKSMDVSMDVSEKVETLNTSRKKIVEIAKALGSEATIILMDEPTASLTSDEQKELFRKIRMLKQRGVSIIYVSHGLEEILEITDRITILREGKKVATKATSDTNMEEIIALMVGKVITNRYPKRFVPINDVILEINGISRANILKSISFHLRSGEILGLAGRVGSGRTELARSIFGIDFIDEGEIILQGEKMSFRSATDAINNGIAYLTEDRKKEGLVPFLSLKDNFVLASINSKRVLDSFTRYRIFLLFSFIKNTCLQYMKKLEIKASSIDQKAAFLSGGNQQKLIVSKWLSTKAKVFIFDEPTVGIDIASKVEIYRIMQDLAGEGMGIIMISSELEELVSLTDRMLILRNGEIVGEMDRAKYSIEKILQLAAVGGHKNSDEVLC